MSTENKEYYPQLNRANWDVIVVGSGFGVIAENSYGFAVGNALDIRIGLRSTTAFNVTDDKKNKLGTVGWLDGILVLGVSL